MIKQNSGGSALVQKVQRVDGQLSTSAGTFCCSQDGTPRCSPHPDSSTTHHSPGRRTGHRTDPCLPTQLAPDHTQSGAHTCPRLASPPLASKGYASLHPIELACSHPEPLPRAPSSHPKPPRISPCPKEPSPGATLYFGQIRSTQGAGEAAFSRHRSPPGTPRVTAAVPDERSWGHECTPRTSGG